MKALLILCLSTIFAFSQKPSPLLPGQVVVVYNSTVPGSKDLAEFYALNRLIPEANLVGLEVTEKPTIGRKTYNNFIRDPLRKKFTENRWWTMGKNKDGRIIPTEAQIRCIVMIKGMPLRISRTPASEGGEGKKPKVKQQDEAAVDSELALMGLDEYPLNSARTNPYFKQDLPFAKHPAKYLLLVGRLEASSFDQCKRMVLDALDVEKEGLWGRAYLDFSNKTGGYALGDKWIENIAKLAPGAAHPTIIDRTKDTFVTNYPMNDAAVYFGWYTTNRNGPFLNPAMKFKKGAIAVHIHSFSASQLRNPAKNWSAGLIDRGAAATLGNTWEPYLQASHHLDIFYARLLKGYSLIEAGYMSMNALSWQNIVIGDPLYTPYRITEVTAEMLKEDRQYKIIRYAGSRFPDPKERLTQLVQAAEKTKNGSVYEMLGFVFLEDGNVDKARKGFARAKELFTEPSDKLRQDLNLVELERRQKNTKAALTILRKAKTTYSELPEAKAIDGLLVILDPPAPPATKPKK
ncbi:MAG: TIGR03790 family protein [Akkermansiaceae bacterium]|jgi:uncharacterized protein (TIGR03790 family)